MGLESILGVVKEIAGEVLDKAKNKLEDMKAEFEAEYERGQEEVPQMSNAELLHTFKTCGAGGYRKAVREELDARGIEYKTE